VSEMTDIWDEKPVSDYPTVSKHEIEMDAWLSGLKTVWESNRKVILSLSTDVDMLRNKLEAVETHYENRPRTQLGLTSIGYTDKEVWDWMVKLKEILEADNGT